MQIERLILSSLLRDPDFQTKTAPYLKPEYFQDQVERELFLLIYAHLMKYKTAPDKVQILVDAQAKNWQDWKEVRGIIESLWNTDIPSDKDWMMKKTEEFCQHRAIYNAIMQSISIYDGTNKDLSPLAIPELVKEAVGVSFDSEIGMDLFQDTEARYDYYTQPEYRVPFKIGTFNEVTNGGLIPKSLTLFLAPTNAGKTMLMISLACDYIRYGFNVLYISMEMREEEILRRVDANLLDIDVNQIGKMQKSEYLGSFNRLQQKSYGKLKVKGYPPSAAHCAHFNHLLEELDQKKNFKPTVLIVDYLGIIASSRIKMGSQGPYFYLKAASEELRAIAVEKDLVCISAMQINRGGMSASDFELSDISESVGVTHTADAIFGMIRTDELDQSGQILIKQLKNRFGNKTDKSRFLLGVNLANQQVYDISNEYVQKQVAVPEEAMKQVSGKSLRDKFRMLNSGQ